MLVKYSIYGIILSKISDNSYIFFGGLIVNSIGEQIKHYRNLANLTIQDLAELTKISMNHLQNMEDDNFTVFKGDEIYVKVYLKRIAKELKVDEHLFLDLYITLIESQKNVTSDTELVKTKIKTKQVKLPKKIKQNKRVYRDSSSKKFFKYFLIFVFVAVVIYCVWASIFITVGSEQTPDYVTPQIGSIENDEELEAKLEEERLEQERLEQEALEELENAVVIIDGGNGFFNATELNVSQDVVIKVIFNKSAAFNLWTQGSAIAGAYKASYEPGEVYEYTTSFVEDQLFTLNFWNLNDIQIFINNKEIEYDKNDIAFRDNAYFINVTVKGAINESAE